MKKLWKTFKSLSHVDRFKMLVVLPILCALVVFSELVDLVVYIAERLLRFLKTTWKEVIVVFITLYGFMLMTVLLS